MFAFPLNKFKNIHNQEKGVILHAYLSISALLLCVWKLTANPQPPQQKNENSMRLFPENKQCGDNVIKQ